MKDISKNHHQFALTNKWVLRIGLILVIILGLIWWYVSTLPKPPACDNPRVKGNISYRTGVKIYHLPGERLYEKTIIDTGAGERMFCTEQDAKDAGWRHTEEQ
jgi:hypothetical protein